MGAGYHPLSEPKLMTMTHCPAVGETSSNSSIDLFIGCAEQVFLMGFPVSEYETSGWDLAEGSERLTVNAVVATVMGSITASSDTVESEGRQKNQCWISYIKKSKKFPL